jgi:hypothetical protein
VLKVEDPHTEADLIVKAIQYSGRFEMMKKLSLLGKGYQIEKRVIGDDDVGERIYSRRIHTTRAESVASENLINLIKVFFLSTLALGLGLPHQSTLATPIMIGLDGKIALAFQRRPKRSSKDFSRRAAT